MKNKKMDRYLVSRKQKYEPRYVAKILKVPVSEVLEAIDKVGRSRNAIVLYLAKKNEKVILALAAKVF